MNFVLKVCRNGAVLAGLYFFSIFASNSSLGYDECKPVLVFLGTYILAELAAHYKLSPSIPKSKKSQANTFIF